MPRRRRTSLGLLLTVVLTAWSAAASSASAPPVGALPIGPVSTIATHTGELVAVALPERTDGLGWRIARAFDGSVLTEVREQSDVGGNLVVVFLARGAGTTSITFGLTRGERPKAIESRRFDVNVT